MRPNPFKQVTNPAAFATLKRIDESPQAAMAALIHQSHDDPAARTVVATTLLFTFWQIAGRGMTSAVPSLVLVGSGGAEEDPMNRFAAELLTRHRCGPPAVPREGPLRGLKPEQATGVMRKAIRQYAGHGKPGFPSYPTETLKLIESQYRAAQAAGFGEGLSRPYASAWHEEFGLLTGPDNRVILRLETKEDRGLFRRHVLSEPSRLWSPVGIGEGLVTRGKQIAVSGALPHSEWDAGLAERMIGPAGGELWIELPLVMLPQPFNTPPAKCDTPVLDMMSSLLPRAFVAPVETPAGLVRTDWFQQYGGRLRERLRFCPADYEFLMLQLARQIFPVSLRLTRWNLMGMCMDVGLDQQALAMDLAAHALRGLVISTAGLAWHCLGVDFGCPRKEVLRVLEYLRLHGPMTGGDLRRRTHIDQVRRDVLVEGFLKEDLARLGPDGRTLVATTYGDFAQALYQRPEFPEPVSLWNVWTEVAGSKGQAA